MPDKTGSRAASTAHYHYTTRPGFAAETSDDDRRDGRVNLVPTVDFAYPEDGDEPAPIVRDKWIEAPLLEKCSRQRFASVPSGDVMTMPLLDKRMEVLRYALREAVERMDVATIHRLAEKAIGTQERIARERLAASTPGTRERHGELIIEDSAECGRVVITFPAQPERNTRRWLQMCGFFSGCDGITYWRKRTFRRGENIALDNARHCVGRIVKDAARLAAAKRAAELRYGRKPIAA
jgi:hypothetical protein